MSKTVPLQSLSRDRMPHVWGIVSGDLALFRGPMINSKPQADAWIELLKSTSNVKRWVSLQLAIPDTEWPIITTEHFYLEGTWVPHIVVPTPLLSPLKKEVGRSDLQWNTIRKFIQQINCEGWLFYSEWLDDAMDSAITKFNKDAADEFQVEAALKDFHHEVSSVLLRDYRINCAKLVLQLGQSALKGELDARKDYEIETDIVRLHFDIINNLNVQREVLINIEECIRKIEHLHPELIPLKQTIHILSTLLGYPLSWVQTQLLIGLLNHQLRVGCYLNCDSGFDRTNLAFAIHLALAQMIEEHSVSDLIHFAELYPEQDTMFQKFKRLASEYLRDVCLPLTHSNPTWASWTPDPDRMDAFFLGREQMAL